MDPRLLLYFAPSALALYWMIDEKTFYLKRFGRLFHRRKAVTLNDWLAVYRYLGLPLEKPSEPPHDRPDRGLRLIEAGALAGTSAALLFIPLPFRVPFSFAQFRWDLSPIIEPLIAGTLLALSLLLAFHRWRAWWLADCEPAEYPFVEWKKAMGEPENIKENKK